MFNDEFIEKLPENKWKAIQKIWNQFFDWDKSMQSDDELDYYDSYLEAFAFLNAFLEKIDLAGKAANLNPNEDEKNQIKLIRSFFYSLEGENFKALQIESSKNLYSEAKSKFSAKLGAGFAYEFSEGDLKKIQININDLRKLITDSEVIEDNHKQRLLKRLERLQSELHKKMSDLDRFWGFVGDAGVVMGKFGTDVKPLTDRIREMMGIVWNTQARAEELESGSPNPFLQETNDDD